MRLTFITQASDFLNLQGIYFLLLILIGATSCTPWDLEEVSFPEVKTVAVEIDPSLPKALLKGEIGGLLEQNFVDQHGHIWSTTEGLSLNNNEGQNPLGPTGNGEFESQLDNLTPGRTYFYRAYIIFNGEEKYGMVQTFKIPSFTPQLVIDSVINPNTASSTVYTTITGLKPGIELLSYGLTWNDSPQLITASDEISPQQGLLVSESAFQFESQITLSPGINYVKPYLVIGDTTIYGQSLRAYRGDVWIQRPDFGGGLRYEAVGFSIAGKGYVGAGINQDFELSQDFWEYDPQTHVWTQIADFEGSARSDAVGFSIGNKGFAGVGDLLSQDFWEYDPQANDWIDRKAFEGASRDLAVGFSIGNRGYIGTGRWTDGGSDFRIAVDFWEYDPVTDSWTQRANFEGRGRIDAVGFSIGNKGYIGTGSDYDSELKNDFWEYDPLTDSWDKRTDFGGEPRRGAVGFAIGDKGFIGMGRGDEKYLQDFWEYDPQTNVWSQRRNMEGPPRVDAVGFSIGNKGYIGTGENPGVVGMQDFWEYTPIEE